MKRLLAVLTLIFALSLPCFAGHTVVGGGGYCDCGTRGCIEDYPGECGGPHAATQPSKTPSDATAELGIVIVTLLLWLRLRT